jgi:hypothetical protein
MGLAARQAGNRNYANHPQPSGHGPSSKQRIIVLKPAILRLAGIKLTLGNTSWIPRYLYLSIGSKR